MTNDLHLPLHEALGITRPAVFATVGGGGKTTVLFALAAEWEAANGHYEWGRWGPHRPDHHDQDGPSPERAARCRWPSARTTPLEPAHWTTSAGEACPQPSSARAGATASESSASTPTWPRQAVDTGLASLVGVEADGSKGRPFKAPATHEPVLPEGVDIVAAVIGAGVLGRPLDERSQCTAQS